MAGNVVPTAPDSAPGFWDRVRVPRFRGPVTRIILFTSPYFLTREIAGAAARLGWQTIELPLPPGGRGSQAFVESLLEAAATFRPDFALTVNHLGLDGQGELMRLFEKMALPLASWFVDSPRLILHDHPGQASPWCALFTWDRDTVAPLTDLGFADVSWLPLGTDSTLFTPEGGHPGEAASDVSFVGDSMQRPVAKLARRLRGHPEAIGLAKIAARDFASSTDLDALAFMRSAHPELARQWEAMPGLSGRLDLEQYLTWEATRLYRLERVLALEGLSPLVAGDDGWKELLPRGGFRLTGPRDYYAALPGFYRSSQVSFNATSLQMKGAVNQRVFDVPATGGFLLTDRREQMEELFEPGSEVAVYREPGEIPELTRHYLAHPAGRKAVADKARARVLKEHDYTHRLRTLLRRVRKRYA